LTSPKFSSSQLAFLPAGAIGCDASGHVKPTTVRIAFVLLMVGHVQVGAATPAAVRNVLTYSELVHYTMHKGSFARCATITMILGNLGELVLVVADVLVSCSNCVLQVLLVSESI
jgi:hypothetical protein